MRIAYTLQRLTHNTLSGRTHVTEGKTKTCRGQQLAPSQTAGKKEARTLHLLPGLLRALPAAFRLVKSTRCHETLTLPRAPLALGSFQNILWVLGLQDRVYRRHCASHPCFWCDNCLQAKEQDGHQIWASNWPCFQEEINKRKEKEIQQLCSEGWQGQEWDLGSSLHGEPVRWRLWPEVSRLHGEGSRFPEQSSTLRQGTTSLVCRICKS